MEFIANRRSSLLACPRLRLLEGSYGRLHDGAYPPVSGDDMLIWMAALAKLKAHRSLVPLGPECAPAVGESGCDFGWRLSGRLRSINAVESREASPIDK